MNWSKWYNQYASALFLYARQWTPTAADAEDALQEGFIRWWKHRGKRNESGAPERDLPLLFIAVKHAAFDIARARRRRRKREEAAAEMLYHNPPLFLRTGDSAEAWITRAENALAALPPAQREVVILKIWAGFTFRQIGRTLGVSPNTAASRYRAAIRRLQHAMHKPDAEFP